MNLLTRDKSFYRSLLALAIPVALQNLITFSVSLADNLMVGSLGDTAISGVYMGSQIQTLLQLFSGGVEGAILILAAQYWGKQNAQSIKRIISIGVHTALVIGLLFTVICAVFSTEVVSVFTTEKSVIADGSDYLRIVCFSYIFFCLTQVLISAMRSVEAAKIGMAVSAVSLLTNVCLNYILIFGKLGFPALGVKGAAIATFVSRITETVFIFVYVFRIDKRLKLKLHDLFMTDALLRKDFIRYGLPIAGGNLVWGVNMMGNSMILGRFGEAVIAAASVANTLNTLAFVTFNGMAAAIGIIIGKTVGAGKIREVKEYSSTVQILGLGLGIITAVFILLIRSPFIGLYSELSSEAVSYAGQFCIVLSAAAFGTCYQVPCMSGLVKSGGDISFVFKMDTVFVFFVVLIPAVIAARLGAPAWVVFAFLKWDQIWKCPVAFFKVRKFNWIKNLTRDSEAAPAE